MAESGLLESTERQGAAYSYRPAIHNRKDHLQRLLGVRSALTVSRRSAGAAALPSLCRRVGQTSRGYGVFTLPRI